MTNLIAFLESTASLVAALGALLTGVATVLGGVRQPRAVRTRSRSQSATRATVAIGSLLLFLSLGLFVGRVFASGSHELNVKLTTAAWSAFNQKDFARAIANADKCISEFRNAADEEQDRLKKEGAPPPPKDRVSNEEKALILSRGLLNDVATCYFIKGRSNQELGRRDEAIRAYKAVTQYTYARCWDPRGWFWSPAEAAQERLTEIQ